MSADICGYLAEKCLVSTGQDDLGSRRGLCLDAGRKLVKKRMGEAELKINGIALDSSTVSDSDKIQLAGIAVMNAGDHGMNKCSLGSGLIIGSCGVIGRSKMELSIVKGNLDKGAYGSGKRAVLSLYGNFLTIKLGLYAGRNDNCFFSNT